MDNPHGATNNDTIEQLSSMSTPIVSTLTTATPITSEIVSDFEPDSKFEITTLEMASYDCQDLYSAANLLEPQDVEPHSSTNPTCTEISNVVQQHTENLVDSDGVTLIKPQGQQEDNKSKNSSEPLTVAEDNHKDLESITLVEQPQQIHEQHTSIELDVKPDKPNDCKPDNAENDVGHIEAPGSSVPQAQADQIVTDSNADVQPTKVDSNSGDKSVSDQALVSETNTDPFPADQTSKNSNLNIHPLSQTSVDAQMEKVLDNIVELGGVHQFPQSLVNPEGKEEFLATIHREITGERGSIDLIADVASRQKSIEIEPVAMQEQQPEEVRDEIVSSNAPEEVISGSSSEQQDTTKNDASETLETTRVVAEENLSLNLPSQSTNLAESAHDEKVNEGSSVDQNLEERVPEVKTPMRSSRRRGAAAKEKITVNKKSAQSPAEMAEVAEVSEKKALEQQVEDAKTEEVMTDESMTKKVITEEATTEKDTAEKNTNEKVTVEKGVAEKDMSEKNAVEKVSAELPKVEDEKINDEKIEDEQIKTRSLRPRGSLKRKHPEESPEDNPPKAEPPKKQTKKSRGSTSDHAPMIKLPNFRSRTTISSSDPITRLEKKYETKAPPSIAPLETEKKYVCEQCGYATDRLNNLVYHSTKSFCRGKCQIGEVMKADIIRQQQQAKNKRRSMR